MSILPLWLFGNIDQVADVFLNVEILIGEKYLVYNLFTMNNERGNRKAEQIKTPENSQENEFSIDNINDILKEKTDVYDNLNEFSKDNLFKGYDLRGNVEVRDKAEDKYDSDVYAEASLGKKFASFVMPKKFLGLVKTENRGLVDKNTIEDYTEGRVFRLGDRDKDVYKHEEEKVAKKFNWTEEESKGRVVTKTYEFTNGKIEKIIKSSRTEEGMIGFAGTMREHMISAIDRRFGNDLVGLKESVVKNKQTKENMLKINGFMPEEEKQALVDKLDKEGASKKERIKEKEEIIAEKLNFFKEPLESRMKETSEMENNLSKALNFIKTNESNLNKNIKECEAFIKEAQKLSLSDEMRDDIVKTAEAQRVVLNAQAKEFADKKALVSSKLEVLKNNKKDIEATLNRINNIGKTENEIAKEKKNEKKDGVDTEPVEKKAKSETVEGAKKEEVQQTDENGGKEIDISEILNRLGDFSGKKKESYVEEEKKEVFSEEEIEGIVMKELKVVGFMNNKEIVEKSKGGLIKHLIGAVKNEIIKSEEEITEGLIKSEVDDWYKKLTKNSSKSVKQSKINLIKDEEKKVGKDKNESSKDKTFTEKEIENIATTHLKIMGLPNKIKDRKIQDQITRNVIGSVKKMVVESEEPITEIDIRKETKRIFDILSASFSKKNP